MGRCGDVALAARLPWLPSSWFESLRGRRKTPTSHEDSLVVVGAAAVVVGDEEETNQRVTKTRWWLADMSRGKWGGGGGCL